jgi:hypothetical protein
MSSLLSISASSELVQTGNPVFTFSNLYIIAQGL